MFRESWNASHSPKIQTEGGYSGYQVKLDNQTDYTDNLQLPGADAVNDSLWFPHLNNNTSVNGNNACIGYWLASTGPLYSKVFLATYDGYLYGAYVFTSGYEGLRPVVCLNANVKMTYDEAQQMFILSK